jgi:hypothetical protein
VRKIGVSGDTIDLQEVTTKLYHILFGQSLKPNNLIFFWSKQIKGCKQENKNQLVTSISSSITPKDIFDMLK